MEATPACELIPTDYEASRADLTERVILVTGAGDGLGRAVSIALSRGGATVVLLGKTIHKLETVFDTIVSAGYTEPVIYPMDLAGAMPSDYEALAHRLDDEYGRLNGLLHNAAALGALSPLEHHPLEQWQQVMQVNLNACFLLTRACLPLLKRAADATVVFTVDGVGRRARAYWGAYAASKSAVETLAGVLAKEVEHNTAIRVNVVNPGPLRTRLRAAAYPAEDPSHLASADSVAGAYVYLLGPDGKHVRGRSLDLQPPA